MHIFVAPVWLVRFITSKARRSESATAGKLTD
jgi:hypothetical protein